MSETNGSADDALAAFERIFVPPDDGYTIPSEIERLAGVIPRIRFKYRPAVPREFLPYRRAAAEDAAEVGAKLLASHVFDVQFQKQDGSWSEPVRRLTPDMARRLPEPVWGQFMAHVMGAVGPVRVDDDQGNASSPGTGSTALTRP